MTKDEIVRALFAEADRQGKTFADLARDSGICQDTIRSWYYRKTWPSLAYLIPVLDALDLQLWIL